MKSIRSRLLLTLLPVLGVLWLLGAGALYLSAKRSLYESLDTELRLVAADVPLLVKRTVLENRGRYRDRSSLFEEGGDFYFQVWNHKKEPRLRSQSLGEMSFEFQDELQADLVFGFQVLADGTRLRTVAQLLPPPPKWSRPPKGASNRQRDWERMRERRSRREPNLGVIIGRDVRQLEETLGKIRLSIVVTTLSGIILAALAVTLGVRRSLKPLAILGGELEKIGSDNLDSRIHAKESPKELEVVGDKVNELLERLESAFERERRFGSDLAHELRTPTAEILALAEVGVSWPEQFGESELREILASAKRMKKSTGALLDLARMEDESTTESEEMDLTTLIDDVLEGLTKTIAEKKLTIEREVQDGAMVANRSLLLLILQNLIGNAVAYAPEGDVILITSTTDSLVIDNTAVELAEEDLKHLFERFWRKDRARTAADHAGLGLRLVVLCVKKMGGEIDAKLVGDRLRMNLQW